MTHASGGSSSPPSTQSTPEVAKDEAAEVARTAAQSGGQVAGTVGDQASRVASETAAQARNLLSESRNQLSEQTKEGQRKAAGGLNTLADQLHDMAEKSEGQGVAGELARQAAERTRTVASWLENREPGELLDEVRGFARRKPGVFLAGAALAGVVVGRLTRGVIAAKSDSSPGSPTGRPSGDGSVARPSVPQTPPMSQAVNPAYGGTALPGHLTDPAGATPQTPGYGMPPVTPEPYPSGGYPAGPVTR